MSAADQICEHLDALRNSRTTVGHDIEGTCTSQVTVCSFAWSPNEVLSIPFVRMDWSKCWNTTDKAQLLAAIKGILEDPQVTKICHNALFEMFTWRWLHGIEMANVEDTMLAWHTLYPELDKSLDVVASVLTRQPYWGTPDDWRTDQDRDTYNCIDSAVTLECWQALTRLLTVEQRAYYTHCRDLMSPVLAMMASGMNYDSAARTGLVAQLTSEVFALQGELDVLAGIRPPSLEDVADTVCFARAVKAGKVRTWNDVPTHAKPSFAKSMG